MQYPLPNFRNKTPIKDAIDQLFAERGGIGSVVTLQEIRDRTGRDSDLIRRTFSGMISRGEVKPTGNGGYIRIK